MEFPNQFQMNLIFWTPGSAIDGDRFEIISNHFMVKTEKEEILPGSIWKLRHFPDKFSIINSNQKLKENAFQLY